MRQKLASIAQRLRLPSICVLCNQSHEKQRPICLACQQQFKRLGPSCYHCAYPLPTGESLICGHCVKKRPYVDQLTTTYYYEEPLRSILHEFKYHEGLYFRSFLADLILESISETAKESECLIPVPLHAKRLRQRGFNQAAELTKYLAYKLKKPALLTQCKKILNTPPQAKLSEQDRRKNLKNAFYMPVLPYQHVTLIDDLFTTGSTVNELAKYLKQQGIHRVDVWCCARAVVTPMKV